MRREVSRSTSAERRTARVPCGAACARLEMDIIDFHTHFFSSTYFETLAAQSPLAGDVPTKLTDLAHKTKIELPSKSAADHTRRWLGQMDKFHLKHVCTFASVPEETPIVCEAAATSEGRISAFAFVNPKVEGAAA